MRVSTVDHNPQRVQVLRNEVRGVLMSAPEYCVVPTAVANGRVTSIFHVRTPQLAYLRIVQHCPAVSETKAQNVHGSSEQLIDTVLILLLGDRGLVPAPVR